MLVWPQQSQLALALGHKGLHHDHGGLNVIVAIHVAPILEGVRISVQIPANPKYHDHHELDRMALRLEHIPLTPLMFESDCVFHISVVL